MVVLCGMPSAIDLKQGTTVAICKSIQNNNNPFNKHIILVNNQLSDIQRQQLINVYMSHTQLRLDNMHVK